MIKQSTENHHEMTNTRSIEKNLPNLLFIAWMGYKMHPQSIPKKFPRKIFKLNLFFSNRSHLFVFSIALGWCYCWSYVHHLGLGKKHQNRTELYPNKKIVGFFWVFRGWFGFCFNAIHCLWPVRLSSAKNRWTRRPTPVSQSPDDPSS